MRCVNSGGVLNARRLIVAEISLPSIRAKVMSTLVSISPAEILRTTPRLRGLTWGAEDLGAAVSASSNLEANGQWTSPYVLVRSLCLFAAHASGVQAVDTVMADFRDLVGLERVCNDARRDGFTGKIAIHPAQVPVINQAFTPSAAELAHAQAVLALFAANPDAGTLQLDGKMIDKPHEVQAQRIITMAERLKGR